MKIIVGSEDTEEDDDSCEGPAVVEIIAEKGARFRIKLRYVETVPETGAL